MLGLINNLQNWFVYFSW